MTSFTPSDAQARAIAAIRDWYLNRRHIQQVFRLFGYAGSGKSTITRYAIEALGLAMNSNGGWGGVQMALAHGVPLIVANVGPATFGRDDNALTLVDAHGERELPRADKLTLARALVADIARRLAELAA